MFDMLHPLVTSQEYIEDFKVWTGEKFMINLDRIHGEVFVNMPHGSINRWLFYAFPDMACDLSKQWIKPTMPDYHVNNDCTWETTDLTHPMQQAKNKIIVNRTQRYHNDKITYHFLRLIQKQCLFVGTDDEYNEFCKEWSLEMPRLVVNDFLDLAQALSVCKMFLGNQSMCWNLAEAMKIRRVLEVCPFAENCIPMGPDGYDCYYNGGMEYYVETFLNI